MLLKVIKDEIIKKYRLNIKDRGSANIQVALLSKRILNITEHLKKNKHDHSSRRGLMLLVGHRRRLLKHLKKYNINSYNSIIKSLKLRK